MRTSAPGNSRGARGVSGVSGVSGPSATRATRTTGTATPAAAQAAAQAARAPDAAAFRASAPSASRGFTLIELMVVVALVAIATAVVSLALRDSTQDQLQREGLRLATLLEIARAEARAAALPVVWQPTPQAADAAFRFSGLPADRRLPTHWLDAEVVAQVEDGRGALALGPEPLIGAQSVRLQLGRHSLSVGTDGLQPFAVLDPGRTH